MITDRMIADGVTAVLESEQAVTRAGIAEIEDAKTAAVTEIQALKSETVALMQPPEPA